MDFSALLYLSPSLCPLLSSSSNSFMLMERCWGRKCRLLLDTNIAVLKKQAFEFKESSITIFMLGFFLFVFLKWLLHSHPSCSVFSLLSFLPPVNGTPASQLSTPHSGKSPSPSPTSPGSLSRRRVRTGIHEHAHKARTKSQPVAFSDSKSQNL